MSAPTGRRPASTLLREAQEEAGVPAGRWMGRGLAVLGLTAGQEVTEQQLRNLFGARGCTWRTWSTSTSPPSTTTASPAFCPWSLSGPAPS
ncbi:hypothetical protein [Streptomyces sp. NPDC005969]|uniref:hypothetical protein n=1 Tax=Streptomyces sp. NPDC005969 TaxID=3156722 RepID=UPI0033EA2FBD